MKQCERRNPPLTACVCALGKTRSPTCAETSSPSEIHPCRRRRRRRYANICLQTALAWRQALRQKELRVSFDKSMSTASEQLRLTGAFAKPLFSSTARTTLHCAWVAATDSTGCQSIGIMHALQPLRCHRC